VSSKLCIQFKQLSKAILARIKHTLLPTAQVLVVQIVYLKIFLTNGALYLFVLALQSRDVGTVLQWVALWTADALGAEIHIAFTRLSASVVDRILSSRWIPLERLDFAIA
jgi:hypothetical protein